ncbi:hypothetical protein GCM10011611_61020 [Aliidongia dinghuensis]|uniref:AAA+ ATPase domain-containing protein n=1 Tax=Aliidongia dinghuensis TaxID=1867774 RepID=A0A8J2Z0S8_9PROT|nr:AAA family ATPase [Aliidongia dinghuensis]GGF46338.1 hypothetical protein GCM10011611_61020 [Aliidongia dinghuensis]
MNAQTEDPSYGTPLDGFDLLSLWRTMPLSHIDPALLQRLSGALIGHARRCEPNTERGDLLLRAQGRDASAWLALAEVYATTLARLWSSDDAIANARDRYCSCLLVAAALKSELAAVVLAVRLARTELQGTDIQLRLEALQELAETLDAASPVGQLRMMVATELGNKPNDREKIEPASERDEESEAAARPSMRVLLQKPQKPSDRDMKVIVESFAPLEKPVELLQAPDALWLATELREQFPWLGAAIDDIASELALAQRLGRNTFQLPPTLFVGDPGVGKSTFARWLGLLAGVPTTTLMAGGASDNRTLAGTARGWSSATPCFPLETIRRTRIANPIVLVEEIDKSASNSRAGRIADTLLGMTDPLLSRRWLDECLQVEVDLSQVTWILTANRLDRVPPALRARCRILRFPRPRAIDFEVLLAGILRDIAEHYGVKSDMLPELGSDVVERLRDGFSRGNLQARQLSNLVRRALALQVAADSVEPRH